METKMVIYKTTSKTSGHSYIGQAKDLESRKRSHKHEMNRRKHSYPFYNALRLYGWADFTWEILEVCTSREHMDEREKFYIKLLNTLAPNGYNLDVGGNSHDHHPETIEKLRIANTGANNPMFGKVPWNKGKKASDETRAKQSKARLALKEDPNYVHPSLGKERPDMKGDQSHIKRLTGEEWHDKHPPSTYRKA